jgi:CRP/FNR family transcriptional regulator, cyclic AMP receptor protein
MTQHQLTPDLQLLAALGKQQSFKKGTLIFSDGDKGDALYILLEGRVRAYGSSVSGKEITYGYVSAGEYFGEMTLDVAKGLPTLKPWSPACAR